MAQLPTANVPDRKAHISCFSVDDVGFFEGPEKLLEMWFHLPPLSPAECISTTDLEPRSSNISSGLRIIPRYVYYDTAYLHSDRYCRCFKDEVVISV